jgi:DNA processing protein
MFPERLKDARYPLKIFYYQGDWELVHLPSIAIVGTRNPTPDNKSGAFRKTLKTRLSPKSLLFP